jgi:hemolysin activation/secretion protein
MRRSVLSEQAAKYPSASSCGTRAADHGNRPLNRVRFGTHAALRRLPTRCAGSLAGFLWISTLLGGVACADSIQVDEFTVRWQRPVGLPEFENPRDNLASINLACAEYLAAVGGVDRAGLLAPMPITILNKQRGLGAVVRKSEEVKYEDAGPDDFENAQMVAPNEIGNVAQGVYQSAVDFLVQRARKLAESPAVADDAALRTAVQRFEVFLGDPTKRSLESPGFWTRFSVMPGNIVWFHDTRTKVEGEREIGGKDETLPLPRLTTGFTVDTESLSGLARQFETALEENLFLGDRESPIKLDFEVAARPMGAGSRAVELTASFVGPAEAPALPVRNFAITYRGGDGSELKAGEAEGGYDLPDAQSVLAATTVTLYRVKDGERTYLTDFAPGASAEDRVDLRLDTVFEQPEMLSVGALQSVFQSVLVTLQAADGDGGIPGGDLIGVFVDADDGQLDLSRGCLDSRPADSNGVFKLKVVPGIVSSVRTVASGERVSPDERVNPPYERFDRLRANAPYQPGSPTPQVLRESQLREYLDRQSRHPNRRVDAAITAAEGGQSASAAAAEGAAEWTSQGTVGLDFFVTENKPWTVFVQGSNTGVDSTGEWQTRVGYFNSDAFGNDEIFSIEYVTTNFTDSNAVTAYFDAPVGDSDSLRWKAFAGYSQYTASDVGFVFADFEGESPIVGAELSWNVAQWGKTFLDVVGGVSWSNVHVFNGLTNDTGDEDFLIPYVGARLQRNNRDATTDFAVYLDLGLGSDSTQAQLNKLGRLFPSQDFQVLRFDFAQSFYLDPFFQDQGDLANATLAHELYFRFHGQNSLGNRLVPQFMATAGGFYTVRGYPTSFVAGDNVYLFTGEYRLHIPQLIGIDPNPQPFMGIGNQPFRLRPQFGYGPTDWDLIVRAFIDAGVVENVDKLSFESDENLVGAGFGVELQMYKGLGYPTLRNVGLRVDVGFPLVDPDFTDVDGTQITFVGTLSF